MTDFDNFRGPGPIIHGPDRNHPGLHIIQLADGTIGTATHTDIQTIPIHGQWFTGTKNGLICSWPDKATAQQRADQTGALIGQIAPIELDELREILDAIADARTADTGTIKLVILVDPNGQPLPGA